MKKQSSKKNSKRRAMEGLYVFRWHGASAGYPVFRSNEKGEWGDSPRYRFDTYGYLPKNFKSWNARLYGISGSCGETNLRSTLITSIRNQNKKGLSAAICDTLWDECIKEGALETPGMQLTNRQKMKTKHPGFKSIQSSIARNASKAAHRKNPRLSRVKGK